MPWDSVTATQHFHSTFQEGMPFYIMHPQPSDLIELVHDQTSDLGSMFDPTKLQKCSVHIR